jgi:hypothetical protein
MVGGINNAIPNAALSVQTKKAVRASDPEAWAMLKKGLAPEKDLSFIPTLEAGTAVAPEAKVKSKPLPRPEPVHENKQLSVQTKRAIRASDPEGWAMVKKGLAPREKPDAVEPDTAAEAEPAQPTLRQAISAYESNNMAQEEGQLTDLEELFKQ